MTVYGALSTLGEGLLPIATSAAERPVNIPFRSSSRLECLSKFSLTPTCNRDYIFLAL